MSESQKAKAWRESRQLTKPQLAELTGYSYESIYWFELGRKPTRDGKPGKAIDRQVWHRFKQACAGVEAQIKRKQTFEWGEQ